MSMIFRLALLAVAISVAISAASCGTQANLRSRQDIWLAVDSTGQIIPLLPPSHVVRAIILHNNYSCRECFAVLDTALVITQRHYSHLDIAVMTRPQSTSQMGFRNAYSTARGLLPERPVLVESLPSGYRDSWPPMNPKYGLFGRFNVVKTPALVLVTSDSTGMVLQYDSLFAGHLTLVSQIDSAIDSITKGR